MHSVSPSPGRIRAGGLRAVPGWGVSRDPAQEGPKPAGKWPPGRLDPRGLQQERGARSECLGEHPGARTEIWSHHTATPCSPASALILPDEHCPTIQVPCSNLPVCQGESVERTAPERSCVSVVAPHLWRKSHIFSTWEAEMKLDVNAFQAMKANLLTNLGCISFFPSSHWK